MANQVLISQSPQRYYDNHSIYCDSGVATESQISGSLRKAIEEAEKILGHSTNCKFKINLLVDKEGKYFGFGYIRISDQKIYWMMLGRNPDGTERIEEYPDPDWKPPLRKDENLTSDEILEKNSNKAWFELAEEEDAFIQPIIKKVLPPLVTIPGYEYDEEQIKHLKELAEEKGEENPEIPKIGFFEISRGYATDPGPKFLKHRLCARNVPDWIPKEAFKGIFSFYVSKEGKETYPTINFVESKKGANRKGEKIVFINFDSSTKDALFALLMTKKTRIINPKNRDQKVTLIFMHAFDNSFN
jgi:hypothetical protein